MQQMSDSLKNATDFMGDLEPSNLPEPMEQMRKAAVAWSQMCLENYRDELLRKGLAVSAAIADFLAEMEESLGDATSAMKASRSASIVTGAPRPEAPKPEYKGPFSWAE